MNDVWKTIKDTLAREKLLEASKLNPGASLAEIRELESHIGLQLPESFRNFLMCHNGQAEDGFQFFVEGVLLSTSGIRAQWDLWRSVEEDDMNSDAADQMSSLPLGRIKLLYSNAGWVPLTHDHGGNYVGFDFDPDVGGTQGQVISFGRDEDEKQVFAASFEEYSQQMLQTIAEAEWPDAEAFRAA